MTASGPCVDTVEVFRSDQGPKAFRARKAIISSSVYNNGEVYTPETSRMKGTSVHTKNI